MREADIASGRIRRKCYNLPMVEYGRYTASRKPTQERPHFSPQRLRRSGLSGCNGSAAQGVPEQSGSHLTERRRKGTFGHVHEHDGFGIIVPGVNIWSGSP
jgi:hypothetical protein